MNQTEATGEEMTEKSGEQLRRVKVWDAHRTDWAVVGQQGALHFWKFNGGSYEGGGVEEHRKKPAAYQTGDPPSQNECWLIRCPCWHDGSSLYAEKFLETFKALGEDGVYRRLESEYRERFGDLSDEPKSDASA